MKIFVLLENLSRISFRSCVFVAVLNGSVACVGGQEAPATVDAKASPFGIGSSTIRLSQFPSWIPQMAAIELRDLRAAGGYWNGLEPEPGKWVWEKFDRKIEYLESQGVVPGGLLLGVPLWDKKDHPHGFPMNALPEWSNYVSQIAGRYKGRIKRWEVWNEPPNGTKNAPPSDYAKLMLATYDHAKKADPKCMIGLAAKSVHINYLEQVIQAGAKNKFDFITFHPYEVLGCVEAHPGTESVYMHIVPTVRKMLQAQNPEKADVPIRFTEVGYDARGGVNRQADALVKAYTMGIAQGVECINWYEGMDGDDGPKGLLEGNGKIRPSYTAMAQLIRLLGERPAYLGWLLLNDKHYGFVFQGPEGPVLSTWAATSDPDSVNFGKEVEIIDPQTGASQNSATYELSTSPILVLGIPDSLLALANSNKTKPFSWGGDYSGTKEVSVSMGEKNVEKGLHTLSAKSIAADILTYGGNARTGDIPGGSVFIVDPNFLSYTSAPIEISVVVRRNNQNDKAKLSLEYESDKGYKKAPAFDIPEGDQWSTASWRIVDSQFVNMWAFNFRIAQGKYLIQSVTVKKL